jgi:hypothetical protein
MAVVRVDIVEHTRGATSELLRETQDAPDLFQVQRRTRFWWSEMSCYGTPIIADGLDENG